VRPKQLSEKLVMERNMKLQLTSEKTMHFAMAFFVAYAVMLLPMDAFATDPGGLSNVLCNVVGWFTGRIGAGIATLAIIVIGIGALMGKVSWGMAIIVGLGVGIIFGAPSIVAALSPGAATC
jgi:type IV secretory pathway VirB2 component (pilin)